MRRVLYNLFAIGILLTGVAGNCKKKNNGGGPTEATLVVTLNPAAGSLQLPIPQVDFPLAVTITSTMPPQGVTIDVKVAPDGSSTNFFTETRPSSTSTNNFTITGTPVNVVCVTTVKVTSKTTASNTWTGSYRYSRKP
jgi:hypothetical protein